MKVWLLPGMDGGAALLAPFQRALGLPSVVQPYAATRVAGYDALYGELRARLDAADEPVVVVAESFSGPLAIRLAGDPPPRLRSVVLAATFAQSPRPRGLARAVGPWLFRRRPPAWVVRQLLLGGSADPDLLRAVQGAVGAVSPQVLAARLREVLRVDVREALARARVPGLILHGTRDKLVPRPPPAPAHWERDTLDAPHLLLQTHPEAAARRIARFLRHLSMGRPSRSR